MEDKNKQDDKSQLEKLKAQFSKQAGGDKKPNKAPNGKGGFNFMWVYGAIFVLFIGMSIFNNMSFSAKNTNYSELTALLEENDVEKNVDNLLLFINEK